MPAKMVSNDRYFSAAAESLCDSLSRLITGQMMLLTSCAINVCIPPTQDSNLGMGHFMRPDSALGGGSSRAGSSLWFNYEGKTAEDLLIDLKKWREEVSPLPLTAGT